MSDARTEVDSSSSRSAELATPELPGTSTAMDTGFWDALHAEADADESGPSTPRPDTPPLSAGMTSRSQSVGRGGKDAEETPRRNGKAKKEKEIFAPPLIADLPSAWDEAHESFAVLEKCVYESKRMGASKEQDEMMVCDCVYDRRNPDSEQCGSHSDCVNRAIFIECIADQCRAKGQCRNQRFNKREFADLEIVKTELKGFGLRAGSDIPAGDLIYEYIGEVVGETTFRKRMASYGEEGIKHFYFMMLQKEEYIDATKKGGIGRFANHSCNPNCEVQKWVVGRRLRMGIFAKRDIHHNEEITFNYNVDRYGHEAQICYCGEPGCVGYIGGKTQTDIGGINDLFLDALGITDQVEAEGMKGSKKKKARHLDEDFTPVLNPIIEPEVQKVAAAIRQSMENQRMMRMLLERVAMTEDYAIHRQLVRMHGLSLMFMILTELGENRELVLLALQSMTRWKLQLRNKIEDSNIEEPVKRLQGGIDAELSTLAQFLLDQWATLELSYKIARVSKIASLDAEDDANTQTLAEAQPFTYSTEHRKPHAWENTNTVEFTVAPIKYRPPPPSFARPPLPPSTPSNTKPNPIVARDRSKLDAIIALAQQQAAAAAAATPAPQSAGVDSPAESSRSSARRDEDTPDRAKRAKISHADDDLGSYGGEADIKQKAEERKEKRMAKLIGEVVVSSMSKYRDVFEKETFKKYARDCANVLLEKEKRHTSYINHRKPTLSDDKKAKIKVFTKEFTHKLMKRLKEKGKLKPVPSASESRHRSKHASSSVASTPSAMAATPSTSAGTVLETPRTSAEADELDDIFGVDDPEEAGDDAEESMMDVDVDAELAGMDMAPLKPAGDAAGGPKGRLKFLQEARQRREDADDEEDQPVKAVRPITPPFPPSISMTKVDTWTVGAAKKQNGASKVYVPPKQDEGKDTPIRTPNST